MKYLYILAFVSVPLFSLSQRIDITKGPILDPKEIRNDLELPKFAFGGFVYSTTLFFDPAKKKTYTGIGYLDKTFHFAVLDNYLNYTGVKRLTSESINGLIKINAFMMVDNKMYVIYSIRYPDQDLFSVYVNEVSEAMVILGSPIVLHTFKDLKEEGMNLSMFLTHDKKKLLIYRVQNVRPKEKQKIECKVVNDSFAEVWFRTIEMQGLDKDLDLRSIGLDNAGNLFCLIEQEINKTNQPVVYTYFWKTKSFKTFPVGSNNGKNFGTRLTLLNGEKPYIVGLNENSKKITYFIHRIDVPTEALVSLGSSLMPADFYKTSSFRIFSTQDWSVRAMVSLDNNTIVASVEAILVDTKYQTHNSYNTYVLAFREDGTEAWARTIQKKQSTMKGLAGHMLIPANENVLVIYNDHEKNITKKPDDPKVDAFVTKNGMAVVQEIDPKGNTIKYPLTKDPALKGYMVNVNMVTEIEKGLFFTSCINVKGMFNIESRNVTLHVK